MNTEQEALLPDPTKILTLSPDEPEPILTPEEEILKQKKEKAQKCKVIALYGMGHHPIKTNVSNFNQRTKLQVLNKVKELFEKPDAEIQEEFNQICCEVVFCENNKYTDDYTTYPVYKSSPISSNSSS